jgi:N-acyl-L-homoserine lactone synthetase
VIVTVKGNEVSRHAEISEQAWRLRHRIFVEELGWSDLRRPDGREIDQFDHEEAIHHHCIRDGRVVGYQRLLPTTRPHLLTDVMPEFATDRHRPARRSSNGRATASRRSGGTAPQVSRRSASSSPSAWSNGGCPMASTR